MKQNNKEKRTLCYFCKKPIHITKFAGVFSHEGEPRFMCNNFVCLAEYVLKRKGENEKKI